MISLDKAVRTPSIPNRFKMVTVDFHGMNKVRVQGEPYFAAVTSGESTWLQGPRSLR